MNDDDFQAARAALVEARRAGRRIDPLPPGWIPASLDEACRLQQAAAAELGTIRGWKISGVTADQQQAMGVPCPLAGALLAPWVRDSGGSFELARFVRPRLECEFAFELKHDLPVRATPYARSDVERAIGALRVVVEIVDTRLPPGSTILMELADALNNGAFVVGPACAEWRSLRYADQKIVLRSMSGAAPTEIAHGDGRAVLDGDPVGAVVLLANLAELPDRGLLAGDIVTTGSCTGAVEVPGPGDYEADFGALGRVRLRLVG
jgi:2-keto-4-pentenoate hydratase